LVLTFGRPLLSLWFTPIYYLSDLAQRAIAPFLVASQWTT
jgi:hypothetical protein